MPLKTHRDEQPELNLTPMIDVVFNLIIFFMVGTKFTELDKRLGLQVPEVAQTTAMTAAPDKRLVSVFQDGSLMLDQEPVTIDQMQQKLAAARAQYPDVGVTIRGDGRGLFQRVAEVLNACKLAGINELGIAVQPVTEEARAP